MRFKRIELDGYERYRGYYYKCRIYCSETSFLFVYLHSYVLNIVQAFACNFYWHKLMWEGKQCWLPPVGDWDEPEDWQAMLSRLVPAGTTFMFVPEYLLQKWQGFSAHIEVEELRSEWDYVYSLSRQIAGRGTEYRHWRTSLNQFQNKYPDYSYASITAEDIEDIRRFQEEWMDQNRDKMTEELRNENQTTMYMLAHWQELPNAVGCLLRVGGRLIAFFVAEKLEGNMLSAHFLKADQKYKGAARFIKKLLYQQMWPEYQLINLWGDADLSGLRQNKLAEKPVELYKKYRVLWKG